MIKDNCRITVLLPTRGRQEPLRQALATLIETAHRPDLLELMLAFDDDDRASIDYFASDIVPWLRERGVPFKALEYPRYGYNRLHLYINDLVKNSTAPWILFWNDDAVMHTKGWDTVISFFQDRFLLLRAETNHEHPYAIFPIFPREWYDITGHVSQHPLNDAWLSQVGYLLDIVADVPIYIEHERHDLTGKNQDATYNERQILEGNPNNPLDFLHIDHRQARVQDGIKIAAHLKQTRNMVLPHYEDAMSKRTDPWNKMMARDHKGLMARYELPSKK